MRMLIHGHVKGGVTDLSRMASFRWAEASGIRSSIVPETFDGGLRGAGAAQDIAAGRCPHNHNNRAKTLMRIVA